MELTEASLPPQAWSELAAGDPRATLFHTPVWTRAMLAAYPRYTASYLCLEDGGLLGLMPYMATDRVGTREVVSLPFGTYGGPVLSPEAPSDAAGRFARAFRERTEGARVIRYEVSIPDPTHDMEEAFRRTFGERASFYDTYMVPLEKGFDWLWTTGFHKEVRTCSRAAERKGVTVADETGPEAVAELAALHAAQSQAWGVRPHPVEALQAVVDTLGEDARVWVARREGRALTACLTLYLPGREVIPWVSGANEEARRTRAYHALMTHIMRDGADRGFARWNWGGSAARESVEFFKKRMAGEPFRVLRVFHEAGWRKALRR